MDWSRPREQDFRFMRQVEYYNPILYFLSNINDTFETKFVYAEYLTNITYNFSKFKERRNSKFEEV